MIKMENFFSQNFYSVDIYSKNNGNNEQKKLMQYTKKLCVWKQGKKL